MRARPIAVVIAAVALLTTSVSPQVDRLYSVSSADGTLRNVTIIYASTVWSTPIVTSTSVPAVQVHGLARDAATGVAWAFVTFAGSTAQSFCTLDLGTGVATVIAPATGVFVGLTCRADGTLFAVRDASPSGPATLHTIDPATGQATLVMALPTGTDGEAIVFAPDQALYRASGRGDPNVDEVLERIPLGTGVAVSVPLVGDDYDGLTVLASYTGSYLIGVDRQDQLHVLTTAGHVRHFAALDHGDVTGLLFVPATTVEPFFRAYGDGCAGSTGAYPMLLGCGHASGGHNPGVHLRFAPANAIGLLAAGAADGTFPFPSVTCAAQIVPVFYTAGLVANASGDFYTYFALPVGTLPNDIYFQVALLDGASLLVTNPVRMHVQ